MRYRSLPGLLVLALTLSACGGGGGDGGAIGGGNPGGSNAGGSTPAAVTFTAPATITQSADAGIGSNPTQEFIVQFSAEPAADDEPGYAFSTIGIQNVAFFRDNGSTTRYRGVVYFKDSVDTGPGTYNDVISLGFCTDAQCSALKTGRTKSIAVTYTITGTQQPPVSVTASTAPINEQAVAFTNTRPEANIHLDFQNVRANNSVTIQPSSTTSGVNGWSYERISETEGNVHVTFKNASTLEPGTYDDVITINVCQGNKCPTDVIGSPIVINAHYVVAGTVAGTNGYRIRIVRQSAIAITWDAVNARLYLAVPPDATTHANSVVALDPATGLLGASGAVGNFPWALDASTDGQFLYVAPRDANELRRFKLPSLAPDATIPLGADSDGQFGAQYLAVVPGAPHSVAAVRRHLPFGLFEDVAIYDDAVPRANVLNEDSGLVFANAIYSLKWVDANTLYGASTGTEPLLYKAGVNASGLTLSSTQQIHTTVPGIPGSNAFFDYAAGLIYLDHGAIFDPASDTLTAALEVPGGYDWLIGVLPDPANGRIFAIAQDFFDAYRIQSYDIVTRQPIASIPLYGLTNGNSPMRLTRWGADGLALATFDGRVLLINGTFVAP